MIGPDMCCDLQLRWGSGHLGGLGVAQFAQDAQRRMVCMVEPTLQTGKPAGYAVGRQEKADSKHMIECSIRKREETGCA